MAVRVKQNPEAHPLVRDAMARVQYQSGRVSVSQRNRGELQSCIGSGSYLSNRPPQSRASAVPVISQSWEHDLKHPSLQLLHRASLVPIRLASPHNGYSEVIMRPQTGCSTTRLGIGQVDSGWNGTV